MSKLDNVTDSRRLDNARFAERMRQRRGPPKYVWRGSGTGLFRGPDGIVRVAVDGRVMPEVAVLSQSGSATALIENLGKINDPEEFKNSLK